MHRLRASWIDSIGTKANRQLRFANAGLLSPGVQEIAVN
jgi:hypothetical protein